MLLGTASLLALLVIVSGIWLSRANHELAAAHRLASTQQTQTESQLVELSSQLSARGQNGDLLRIIAEESRAVNAKRDLIKQLTQQLLLADTRFSRYMRGLSNSHIQGLWLTRLRADGGNLILDGCSLSEELLPQWIHQLSLQSDFRGKEFGLLELSREKDAQTPHLDFHLSTQLKREAEGNG